MNRRGFSLLELSIVLTILAVVVAGGLTLGTAKVQQEEITATYDEMEEIQTALKVFLNEYSRLPCPASITLASSNALYGREATDCADASPPAGLTRVEYPAASGTYVRIGGVPFYALGLPERYLADQYNNRYLYAVTESAITSLTTSSTGNIQVVDTAGTAITSQAVAAIVSAGRTHKGGYASKTGTLFSACDATNKDKENCDADGVFTNATFNDGSTAANFYDDLIVWNTRMTMFETVSTAGSGFEPWTLGPTAAASAYPLQVKGLTTASYAGNTSLATLNAACATAFAGSWVLRVSDFQYIDDVPILASQGRVVMDACDDVDTAITHSNCSIPGTRQYVSDAVIRASGVTTLDYQNCDNWTSNAAMPGTNGYCVTRASVATPFRRENDNSVNFDVVQCSCTTTYKAVCVGER